MFGARVGQKNNTLDLDIEDEITRPNLDPETHGPAIWDTWNHLASQANTPRRRQKLRFWVEEIIPDMFGCGKCRNHIPTHLKKFPIQNYMGSAEQMLLHAYLVHDSVSRSIPGKKDLPSFADIKKIYFPSKEASCHTVCTAPEDDDEGAGSDIEEEQQTTKAIRQPVRKPSVVTNMSSQKRTAPASMSKKISPTRTVANEEQRQPRYVRRQ